MQSPQSASKVQESKQKKLAKGNQETESRSQRGSIEAGADFPLSSIRNGVGILQPKLKVGAQDDVYEREADQVADQIMRMPLSGHEVQTIGQIQPPSIQKKCKSCDEDELQEKPLASSTRIQRKVAGKVETGLSESTSHQIEAAKGGGSPLDASVLQGMQNRFGRDFTNVRIHTNGSAAQFNQDLNAKAFATGNHIFFGAGQYQPHSPTGMHLLAHELTHTVQQGASGRLISSNAAPIQRKTAAPNLQMEKPKGEFITRSVIPNKQMNQTEFKLFLNQEIFGNNPPAIITWNLFFDTYEPNVRYLIDVQADLFIASRNKTNADEGIELGKNGGVAGAGDRAKTFLAGPNTKSKQALMAEIDRRYYDALNTPSRTPIDRTSAADAGKRALWNQIRDEVLYQNEYVRNLPAEVKKLIKFSTDGKPITLEEIDQLFKIAKKIEGMDPNDIMDYASKINATTSELSKFEESLDTYIKARAERKAASKERIAIQDKLAGNEDVYALYKRWKGPMPNFILFPMDQMSIIANEKYKLEEKAKRRAALEKALLKKNFKSIAEFETYITKFEAAFQKEAQNIALDILAKYEGRLYQEGQRYKNPVELEKLYQNLGGFRTKYMHAARLGGAAAATSRGRPSMPNLPPGPGYDAKRTEAAYERFRSAQEEAKAEVKNISGTHPIFIENHLNVNDRIDKRQLALADKTALAKLIEDHIAAKIVDIKKARKEIVSDPQLVFKLDKLMPRFYASQGMVVGGVPDQIIKDKIKSIHRNATIISVILAVLAIALAIISFGTAIPFIAAAAAVGGVALSAYFVYEEYSKYATENNLAAVGFADDPSMFWLIVAVAGAALDLGAAVKAMRAIGPAAKLMVKGTASVDDFAKAVRLAEAEGKINAKIARAAENAARSHKAYQEAAEQLSKAMSGKLYSFPGPLVDPDLYLPLFRMAKAKISHAGSTFELWLAELNAMRVQAKMAQLSADEIEIARRAWAEAKAFQESATTPVELLSTAGKPIGTFSKGRELVITSKSTNLFGGNTIKLSNRTTTITGTLNDVNAVATRGRALPGSAVMGANEGGINILRSPKWGQIQAKHKHILDAGETSRYWKTVTDEFWTTANKPWLDAAIRRGDNFRFVSNPADEFATFVTNKAGTEFVLEAGAKIRSIFGREVDYLTSQGYRFLPDGTAIKGP